MNELPQLIFPTKELNWWRCWAVAGALWRFPSSIFHEVSESDTSGNMSLLLWHRLREHHATLATCQHSEVSREQKWFVLISLIRFIASSAWTTSQESLSKWKTGQTASRRQTPLNKPWDPTSGLNRIKFVRSQVWLHLENTGCVSILLSCEF